MIFERAHETVLTFGQKRGIGRPLLSDGQQVWSVRAIDLGCRVGCGVSPRH